MSEVDQLVQLVDTILMSQDKAIRQNAENTLVQLRTSNPNELMLSFIMILGGQYKTEHRNFAATQIRLSLSAFAPASYQNLWQKVTPETQSTIKTQLFQILFNEPDLSMKKHIADTLGEVAASAINAQPDSWPQFKLHLWELFKQDNQGSILAAFNVLETFLPLSPETFEKNEGDLFTLFKNGFVSDNPKMKLAAIKCFSSYLQILEPNRQKNFKLLIPDIFNTVYALLLNDKQQQGLEMLSDMLEVDVKFFKKNYNQLNQLLQNIFKIPNVEGGVKRMATEILVDFSEKAPSLFRKNNKYIESLLQMVFVHMMDIDNEVSEEWKKPEEGYNQNMEDDEDFQTTRFGMGAIDRIIYAIGDKQVLPILSNGIKNLLAQNDWRQKYTAIMALSQIGQYIQEAQTIESIVSMIISFFGNQNPMLRYAACHAIGQISDDMQPKFQELYGDAIYPQLINLLQDPVPRVVSHSAACLTNFLQGMKVDKIAPNADQMMELLISHCNNSISIVKESCLGAISSVAEATKKDYQRYLEASVQTLFNIIDTHTSKQYKQVRGQAIETMTMIAAAVGPDNFRPAIDKLVNIMITMQSSQFEQTDPQKSYILAGWQRLCLEYGKQLAQYLDRILPSLFALVQNVINNELNLVNNPEPKEVNEDKLIKDLEENINTFQTEEAEIAISMLNVFIDKLKELYGPYVQSTAELLCKIIKEHSNEDVKEEACKCLPNLVKSVKQSDKVSAISMTKYFMEILVKTIEDDPSSEVVIIEIETLKLVIEELDVAFLNESELSVFSQKVMKMLSACEEMKKATTNAFAEGEELDDEDKQAIGQGIKFEQEKQVAISQLMGILFKTHKDMAMPLAEYIINNILSNTLKPGLSENMYKFSIFIIDDMIEYLGYQRLQAHWFEFYKAIQGFCAEKSCELRQAACYGMGILAENTPSNVLTSQTVVQWLTLLANSSRIPKGSEKEKTYGNCKDNAIASMGKTIKTHWSLIQPQQYLEYWLSCLPLKFDKPQGIIQHEFLVDILLSQPDAVLGSEPMTQVQNLIKILNIFGVILNYQKICSDGIKIKLKQYLLGINTIPHFSQNQNNIWNSLGEKQKEALVKLLKSN